MGSKQEYKHQIGLAGEFLVAGELLRRGIHAAVTFGNAKKIDVVAVRGVSAAKIEVKCTSQKKWVVGNLKAAPKDILWVFVYLPNDEKLPPEYYILSPNDLHKLLDPIAKKYRADYIARNGREPSPKGVDTLEQKNIPSGCKGAWEKISDALNSHGKARGG